MDCHIIGVNVEITIVNRHLKKCYHRVTIKKYFFELWAISSRGC